jgi:hypothetical protein
MDAKELHQQPAKNLLDKIASDPDIINRGAPDAPAKPAEASAVPPAAPAPAVPAPTPAPSEAVPQPAPAFADKPAGGQERPLLNLIMPNELARVPEAVGKPGTEGAVAAGGPAAKKRHGAGRLVAIVILLIGAGGAGAYYFVYKPAADTVAVATPKPSPAASPTPVATATPAPTPTATPSPSPAPQQVSVTAPAAAPTAEHPQVVTVKAKSGLWHRSTPDSSNQKNVIGWIPYNAQVSVDATGTFWWHGTYNGKSGYFAVSYTK